MNIGLEHLAVAVAVVAEEEIDTSPASMVLAQLEYVEAIVAMDNVANELDSVMTLQATLEDISAVVKEHGATEAIVSMIGADFEALSPDHANKDQTAICADLVVSIEGIKEKVKQIIAKIIAAIKNIINTVKTLLKKSDKALINEIKRVKGLKNPVFSGKEAVFNRILVLLTDDKKKLIDEMEAELSGLVKMLNSGEWDDRKLEDIINLSLITKDGMFSPSIEYKTKLITPEEISYTSADIPAVIVELSNGKLSAYNSKINKANTDIVKKINLEKILVVEGGAEKVTPQDALKVIQLVIGINSTFMANSIASVLTILTAIVEGKES